MVARTVRDTPALLWPPRLALGFVAAFVVLISTGSSLGSWSLLPAIIVGASTAWRSNGRRLLQIGAELAGQSNPSMPNSAMPSNTELVPAINIRPGDWACSYSKYQKMLEETKRERRNLREPAEKGRAESGQVDANQSQGDQPVTKDPAIPLEWVIATAESADTKKHILRFASGDVYDPWKDQQYYRRRPKARPTSQPSVKEASQALSELLTSLASGSASESDLINKLAKSHSESSIYRAIRAAISQRLIEQEVGIGRSFREVCAIFSPHLDARLRTKCLVKLSTAGDVWVRDSGASAFGNGGSKATKQKRTPDTITNFFIGDTTFHAVISTQGVVASDDGQPRGAKTSEERSAVTENRTAKAMPDSADGLTVAWSAGVSATGAGLAALLLTGEAPWQRALFISLIFISGCAFVLLICVGLPNMKSWWRARRHASLGRDTSGGSDPVKHGAD